jgi:hypothetical protein
LPGDFDVRRVMDGGLKSNGKFQLSVTASGAETWVHLGLRTRHHHCGSSPMQQTKSLTRVTLKTPRAAGIAGIIFSVLLLGIFGLLRILVPIDPLDQGSWLPAHAHSVGLALNLVPFAGIAFLWFIGVIRDRLGGLEDRFFATVFLGSALLFLAMLFAAAAVGGALILIFRATT